MRWLFQSMPESLVTQNAMKKAAAFSLSELLVVLALISVLALLVAGGSGYVMRRTDKAVTVANWREISAAIALYSGEHQGMLPGPLASSQRATYYVSQVSYPVTGALGYYLAPYLAPDLEGQGQLKRTKPYTIRAFQSPAMRKRSPLGDDATQFFININIYTHPGVRFQPFGVMQSGTPVVLPMRVIAAHNRITPYARLSEVPMFFMADRYYRHWSEGLKAAGIPEEPLFGKTRLALFFDGHVGDYFPNAAVYPEKDYLTQP